MIKEVRLRTLGFNDESLSEITPARAEVFLYIASAIREKELGGLL